MDTSTICIVEFSNISREQRAAIHMALRELCTIASPRFWGCQRSLERLYITDKTVDAVYEDKRSMREDFWMSRKYIDTADPQFNPTVGRLLDMAASAVTNMICPENKRINVIVVAESDLDVHGQEVINMFTDDKNDNGTNKYCRDNDDIPVIARRRLFCMLRHLARRSGKNLGGLRICIVKDDKNDATVRMTTVNELMQHFSQVATAA